MLAFSVYDVKSAVLRSGRSAKGLSSFTTTCGPLLGAKNDITGRNRSTDSANEWIWGHRSDVDEYRPLARGKEEGPFVPSFPIPRSRPSNATERRDGAAADRKLNDGVTEPFCLARSVVLVRQTHVGLEVRRGRRARAADQWMDGWVGARAGGRASGFGGRRPRHGGPPA